MMMMCKWEMEREKERAGEREREREGEREYQLIPNDCVIYTLPHPHPADCHLGTDSVAITIRVTAVAVASLAGTLASCSREIWWHRDFVLLLDTLMDTFCKFLRNFQQKEKDKKELNITRVRVASHTTPKQMPSFFLPVGFCSTQRPCNKSIMLTEKLSPCVEQESR